MKKRLGCILVVLAMFFVFAACGIGNADDKATTTADTSKAASTTETAKAEPPTELVLVHSLIGTSPADKDLVIAEASKYTLSKINATFKTVTIPGQQMAQQVRLMLAGNEKIDLLQTGTLAGGDFVNQIANGQLAPLDELLEKYGKGVKEVAAQYLAAGTIKGKVYAVPSIRDEAKAAGFAIVAEYVDKYKIDLSAIKTIYDLEPIFKLLKEKEPGISIFHPGQGNTSTISNGLHIPGGDPLGTEMYFSGVMLDAKDTSLKVVNYYETQQYKDLINLVRKWNQAGYMIPGVTTITDAPSAYIKAGKLASYIQDVKPGIEQQASVQCGKPMKVINFNPVIQYTGVPSSFMWCIPNNCKVKEKAMEFMNLMYTDATLVNLYDYGIEGKHYVKQADGTINYPEGVTSQNSGYAVTVGFIFGNQLLSHVFHGNPPDLYKQLDTFNKSAIVSTAFGFQFDTTPIKAEFAACTNVYNEYERALGTGAVDPEKVLPEFISKLKAAGVDKIVAEKQNQLNEWAKTNKK